MTAKTKLFFFTVLTGVTTSGYTSCQHWTTTTVPASDSTVPIAAPSVILGGDPQIIRFGTLNETVHDLNMNIIAIPAVWDQGGTRTIQASAAATVFCNNGPGLSLHFAPQSDSQTGSTGTTVSQGLYLLHAFRFSNFTSSCNSAGGVREATYVFAFTGRDFFGNEAVGSGTIRYTP